LAVQKVPWVRSPILVVRGGTKTTALENKLLGKRQLTTFVVFKKYNNVCMLPFNKNILLRP
jgi:hypothetical protein